MKIHLITKLDHTAIPENKGEVRLFAIVKNEQSRLPYFLEYYRKLGFDRFFFLDNASEDGTVAYLLEQPDCHVFSTSNLYSEAKSGIRWMKELLDLYGQGHWCLVADADELLVYPHCEEIGIHHFCEYLDREGSDIFFAFLLDMYPKDDLAKAVCVPGKPFLEITPFFDKDYTFVDRIHLRGEKPFPPQEVIGGPRSRCFYGDQGKDSYLRRLTMHVIERAVMNLRNRGIPFPYIRLKATPIYKVPLVKWKKGYAYTASTHIINPMRLSAVSGALLHFKFFSDFHERAVKAVKSGQYGHGSIEYKRYLSRMDRVGNLVYEGTREYKSSADLLGCDLAKTTPEYESFVESKTNTGTRQKAQTA